MALKKVLNIEGNSVIITPFFNFDNGSTVFSIQDSYIRIDKIAGDKSNINIIAGFYESKDNELNHIYNKEYSFTPNMDSSDNFIKQGYEYLKTLEEYSDAVDC